MYLKRNIRFEYVFFIEIAECIVSTQIENLVFASSVKMRI